MPPAEAAPKKKHVRFARMEEDNDNDEQEEDTLFDKRKDVRKGLKSALKGGKGALKLGSEKVAIIRPGRSRSNTGTCWRWLVSLALCASFLGLVGPHIKFALLVNDRKIRDMQIKDMNRTNIGSGVV